MKQTQAEHLNQGMQIHGEIIVVYMVVYHHQGDTDDWDQPAGCFLTHAMAETFRQEVGADWIKSKLALKLDNGSIYLLDSSLQKLNVSR